MLFATDANRTQIRKSLTSTLRIGTVACRREGDICTRSIRVASGGRVVRPPRNFKFNLHSQERKLSSHFSDANGRLRQTPPNTPLVTTLACVEFIFLGPLNHRGWKLRTDRTQKTHEDPIEGCGTLLYAKPAASIRFLESQWHES